MQKHNKNNVQSLVHLGTYLYLYLVGTAPPHTPSEALSLLVKDRRCYMCQRTALGLCLPPHSPDAPQSCSPFQGEVSFLNWCCSIDVYDIWHELYKLKKTKKQLFYFICNTVFWFTFSEGLKCCVCVKSMHVQCSVYNKFHSSLYCTLSEYYLNGCKLPRFWCEIFTWEELKMIKL